MIIKRSGIGAWRLVAAAIVAVLIVSCAPPSPATIPTPPPSPTPVIAVVQHGPTASASGIPSVREVQRLSPAEAKALMDAGKALLYDVRTVPSYEAKHAKGALLLPTSDSGEPLLDKLPKDKLLIFYCT